MIEILSDDSQLGTRPASVSLSFLGSVSAILVRFLVAVVVVVVSYDVDEVALLIHHERVRLHGGGRVVQSVRVLGRFALQLALVRQRAGAAVAEKPSTVEISYLEIVDFRCSIIDSNIHQDAQRVCLILRHA